LYNNLFILFLKMPLNGIIIMDLEGINDDRF